MSLITKIFGTHSEREVKKLGSVVAKIDALSEKYKNMTNEELREKMIVEGKSYVSRFRPEVIAYNIMNCYKRVGVDISEY